MSTTMSASRNLGNAFDTATDVPKRKKTIRDWAREIQDCAKTRDIVLRKRAFFNKRWYIPKANNGQKVLYNHRTKVTFSVFSLVEQILTYKSEHFFNALPSQWDYLWPLLENNGWTQSNGVFSPPGELVHSYTKKHQVINYLFPTNGKDLPDWFCAKTFLGLTTEKNFSESVKDHSD